MHFQPILYLMLLLLFSNCAKDDIIEIVGANVLEVDNCYELWQDDLIINDEESYALMKEKKSLREGCEEVQLPEIDFSSKTILGKATAVVGCSAFYDRVVQANLDKKEYIYTIRINTNTQEECTDTLFHQNWIIVPKLPADYSVRFEIEP